MIYHAVIEEKKNENDTTDFIFDVIEKEERKKMKNPVNQNNMKKNYIVDVIIERSPHDNIQGSNVETGKL